MRPLPTNADFADPDENRGLSEPVIQTSRGAILTSWVRSFHDFLFPPNCAWCFNTIAETAQSISDESLCRRCQSVLAPSIEHRCPRCSARVGPYVANEAGCPLCRGSSFAFDSIVSLGVYEGDLQRACLRCKRTGDPYLGSALTRLLWQREHRAITSVQADFVLAVPHHWSDRVVHRFELSDVVADWLGRFLKVPVERHILGKRKRTEKQLTLSMSARRENLRSTFRVSRGLRLDGATLLLVDDIVTTGTTVHRVSRELRNAGAEKIAVVALARGGSD